MFYWEIYEFFKTAETANGGVLSKKVFIKILQYSHGSICVKVSLQAFRLATLLRASITDVFM